MSEPWDIQDDESSKAYQAFCAYLHLPRGKRSVDEAYRRETGNATAKRASGWWNKWCSDHGWVERARAYDAAELERDIAARREAIERSRQLVVERLPELVEKGVAISTGQAITVVEVETADGGVREREVHASMAEVTMLRHMLSVAGLDKKSVVELSGPAGGPVQTKVTIADPDQRDAMVRLSQDPAALAAMQTLAERSAVLELGLDDDDQDDDG